MQLVGVARVGTRFLADALDRGGVERAQIVRGRLAGAPRLHGVASPLLERRIVEEGVRLRVHDLVREDRRFGRVA